MSNLFFRNRNVPSFDRPDPMRESRDAAFRFALGLKPPSRRAATRDRLPDAGLDRIVRLPRMSFWGRLAEALGLISPRYALAPEEWRLPGSLSAPADPVRTGENVVPINRAA